MLTANYKRFGLPKLRVYLIQPTAYASIWANGTPVGLVARRSDPNMLMLMLFVILEVIKPFLDNPGVSYLLPVSTELAG